jgi:hypothetical protein
MNLQEQVSRIQSMMGVINEDKNYALKIYLQKLIDDTISELREESEDWGLGEMDGIDELNSIEKIEIDRVVDFKRLEIYVNIFVNSPRRDFDNVMSTINYEIQRYIPNSFVQVDDIIDNRTFGPGIDW